MKRLLTLVLVLLGVSFLLSAQEIKHQLRNPGSQLDLPHYVPSGIPFAQASGLWTHKMDSSTIVEKDGAGWTVTGKTVFEVDHLNRMNSWASYIRWYPMQPLEGDVKRQFWYNSDGSVRTSILSGWDQALSKWSPTDKFGFTYYTNGNLKEIVREEWLDGYGFWSVRTRTRHYYGAQNRIERLVVFDTPIYAPGVGIDSTVYYYTANAELDSAITFNYANKSWSPKASEKHTYFSGGELKQRIFYDWRPKEVQWKKANKEAFSYDYNNRLAQESWHAWKDSIWLEKESTAYTYDSNGNIIEKTKSTDVSPNVMVPQNKEEFTYDIDNSLLTETSYSYAAPGNTWMPYQRFDHRTDGQYKLEEVLHSDTWLNELFFGTHEYIRSLPLSVDAQIYQNGIWNTTAVGEYHYSSIASSANHLINYDLAIYPNPAKDYFILTNAGDNARGEAAIYDLNGKEVHRQEVRGNETVFRLNLESGMYFLRTDNGVIKLIITD